VRVFATLDHALVESGRDVRFIVATPPAVHLSQVLEIIRRGHDVMVEKPAFLLPEDVDVVQREASSRGVMVAEMFMYLESRVVRAALQLVRDRREEMSGLRMEFVIPALPTGTFRDDDGLAGSLLADIGCYPLSFLARAGFDLGPLTRRPVLSGDEGTSRFALGGLQGGVAIDIDIGLGFAYSNSLSIAFRDGATWAAEPFFFGRPGERRIREGSPETTGSTPEHRLATLSEGNAFVEMFSRPRAEWLATQESRFVEMRKVASALHRLWREGCRESAVGHSPSGGADIAGESGI
jgi:hypothetical protein